ncbi:MAG: DUF3047 domain-containing protein [candidate division NC10 bacterium]|nr:DUF3047 domain-containing protein [candidate division NC10 bacterium]
MRQLAEHWPWRRRCGVALLVVALSLASTIKSWGQELLIVDFGRAKDKVPQGWELMEKNGKADLALVNDTDGQVLKLRSNSSSFSLNTEVEIDLKKTPFLEWEWKVSELPQGGDFRKSATNDQAAQLLVVFRWAIFGKKEVIAYIWDSAAPKGSMGNDPSVAYVPFLTIRTVVVESGGVEKGKWITETRNVVEDYKKLFGNEPEKVQGIRIQINSQNTKSQAESYWRYVRFTAVP